MATSPEALAIAIEHHCAGRVQAAEQIYRAILQVAPDHVDALHMLGVLAAEAGQPEVAVEYIGRALRLNGNQANLHNDLGEAFRALGRIADAISCYQRAVQLKPDFALAHNNLGNALKSQGQLAEAIACYRQALRLEPGSALAHNNLGIALKEQGHLAEAITCYQQALQLHPNFAQALNNLGNALKEQRRFGEAVTCYRRALLLRPQDADVYANLAGALQENGELDEAVACYQRAVQLRPDHAEFHIRLGLMLQEQGRLTEAVSCFQHALEMAESRIRLGRSFKDQGRVPEAIACFKRALQIKPDLMDAHSNLVFTLQYSLDHDAQAILEEHRRWNHLHAEPLADFIRPHANDPTPDRRLRIGYVSPDFREHCQAFFTTPLFSAHDHEKYEIFCYADVTSPDKVTSRLRSYADTWRDITDLRDEQVADVVRQDGIDILVDLTMHMDRNRLRAFACKPAPVQVCWLAYPGTTGVATIDYRLTDPYLDNPLSVVSGPLSVVDCHEQRTTDNGQRTTDCYSEESVWLPDTFWCYDPLTNEPAVNPLPALSNGFVTFGCLNNFCKVNKHTLGIWARVLTAVRGSRLMLLAPEGSERQHVLSLLEEEGIAAQRVTFVGRQPRFRYLELYHQIDLGLDTLPYNGHTTSLDSAWMGVPVITLVGQTVVGRAGASQLSNLGLRELIAHAPDELVNIASEWASNLSRLSTLRATLRECMQRSPLMDAPRFARNIEAAYRDMWRRWCQNQEGRMMNGERRTENEE